MTNIAKSTRRRTEQTRQRARKQGQMLSTGDVAEILNVSCPYVVKSADSGKLGMIEKTADGRRRIPAAAVKAYRSKRQIQNREALADLAATSQEAGLYEATAGAIGGEADFRMSE